MKTFCIIILIGFWIINSNLTPAQSNLLAPVYPGAVISPLRGDSTQSVYLSKKPIKKVKSFYDSKIGKLSSKDPLTTSFFLENLGNTPVVCYGKTIMTSNQISRQEGYPDPDAKDIGVLLIKKKLPEQNSSNSKMEDGNSTAGTSAAIDEMMAKMKQLQNQLKKEIGKQAFSKENLSIDNMSDLFEGFKIEVNLHRHSQEELINLYNKYKFLDASFYPLVKDKSSGELDSYAHQLLLKYRNKVGNSVYKKDNWNYWVGFLNKLAEHAYATCIIINTKPNTWHK